MKTNSELIGVGVRRLVRPVFYAETANRHYFSKRAACRAEAAARIREKYPSEECETDDQGRTTCEGWHWTRIKRADVLLRRYSRIIFKSVPNAEQTRRAGD